MNALGKLPDAFSAACKFLPCPPQFAWTSSEAVTVSHNIKSETTFTFPQLKLSFENGTPTVGSQRYLKPPRATCAAAQSDAWKLFDGTTILPNDPLLTQGWISPSWVGRPEPPDWNKFNAIAKAKFGWTPGFANNNRCPADSRCRISPDEIKAHSTEIVISFDGGCSTMFMGQDFNYSPDDTSATIAIHGNATQDTLWSVVVPTETYSKIPRWPSAKQ